MKSTANAQHVPTTQHNTTLLLQHKTHSDGRSDTHKPFSLNNHTFFFCSVQPWFSRLERAAKAVSHWSRLISGGSPSCITAAADGKRKVKSPIFEESRKKSSECSHPSNRLSRATGSQTAHFVSRAWETHRTNNNSTLFGTMILRKCVFAVEIKTFCFHNSRLRLSVWNKNKTKTKTEEKLTLESVTLKTFCNGRF